MTCMIGLSSGKSRKDSILAVVGLLSFPYYLWLSVHLYTDIIATFFVFLGFWFYVRDRQILSSISFILAIASRQYMLAFPVAVAAFELISSLKNGFQFRLKHLAPLVAAFSIFGWVLLFKGLVPATAVKKLYLPESPLTWLGIYPNGSLFFLACVGLYFVIPEYILFRRDPFWQNLLTAKNIYLALGLFFLFAIFPPLEFHGLLTKVLYIFPNDFSKIILFYVLAFLACVRFSKVNLAFWILLMNTGIMLKAYPWDKYVLPLLVVFWYLKSIQLLDSSVPDSSRNTPNKH
ncbi:MAG: hypothetical protein WA919_30150 [Coleofasciculaceae cyanobacterium]